MLDELDEEDVKKLKYVAIFGVALILMLWLLLYGLDMLGSGMKKKGGKGPRAEIHAPLRVLSWEKC